MIYLCHPIDQVPSATSVGQAIAKWRKWVLLSNASSTVYQPSGAWRVGYKDTRAVQAVNLQALAHSDKVVALWPGSTPTVGVPVEIGYALSLGKPIELYTDVQSLILDSELITINPLPAGFYGEPTEAAEGEE